MRIAVSGSSGLIGSALVAHLRAQGHGALRLVRHAVAPGSDEVALDPSQGLVDAAALSDAAVTASVPRGEAVAAS